jgi:hypothetical protein
MTARLLFLVAGIAFIASLAPAHEAPSTAPAPHVKRLSKEEIDRLIAQLGSRDFQEREAATEALKRRPEAAIALLRAHRTTSNPEMKRRLQSILPVMMSKEGAEKRLARLPEYAKNLQVDRLIETMVACREFLTEEHDRPAQAMVKEIHATVAKGNKNRLMAPLPEFKSFAWRPGLSPFKRGNIVDRVAAPRARALVAADRVEGDGNLVKCVVLCNGDVLGNTDFGFTSFGASESIIIATGTIRLLNCEACVIVCPGNVNTGGGSGTVIVSSERIAFHGSTEYTTIREWETEFFRAWHLYSAVEAGATLWSAFGLDGVASVVPGSHLDNAGVKPGDFLAKVNGAQTRSVRETNRLLCRATVSWGAADLTIIRGRSRHEILVPLYEW